MKQHLAAGAIIFSDDFNDGSVTGWTPLNGTWTNPGTVLQGQCPCSAWDLKAATGHNFVYEAEVTIISGNAAGLVFRSSADCNSLYDVILDVDSGLFKLGRGFPHVTLASLPIALQRNHPYTIRVVAVGSTLEVWLDEVKQLTATNSGLSSGMFGVMLWNSTATYDNVRAWTLP